MHFIITWSIYPIVNDLIEQSRWVCVNTFTFMHLADAFIQSDLQCDSGYTFFVSMCVPWESNPQPLRCWRNALPLSHRNTNRLISLCKSVIPACDGPTTSLICHIWNSNRHSISHKREKQCWDVGCAENKGGTVLSCMKSISCNRMPGNHCCITQVRITHPTSNLNISIFSPYRKLLAFARSDGIQKTIKSRKAPSSGAIPHYLQRKTTIAKITAQDTTAQHSTSSAFKWVLPQPESCHHHHPPHQRLK